MIDIVAAGGLLALGREGENEAVRIVLLNSWPDAGAVLVLHQRATDKLPHPVTTTEENGNIYWVVGAADTEAPGFGRAEMRWLDDAGRIVKSRVYQTYVDKSIASPSAAPDSWETYVNQVAKDAAAAKEAAKAATAAAESTGGNASAAAEAKEAAESAANLAETAKNIALDYKDSAERACEDAQSAKGGAAIAAGQAAASASAAASSAAAAASSAERAEEAAQKAEDALAAVPGAVQDAAQPLVSQAQSAAGAASASATAAAASAESVKASAEQIKANREAIETITPDDTAIDGKPWTSKKIVDTLSPPIEETGNPVKCYPVAGYPLDVTASWEPVQEGEGEPSPENIRPIVGRDSVTVERCGENLLKITPFATNVKNGVTFEYVPGGGVRILGTASATTDSPTFPVVYLPPGKYYGLYMAAGISASIVVERAGEMVWLNAKGTFKIIKSDIVKYWYMVINNGYTANTTIYPYIVLGLTAPTACTSYQGDTLTLALPETVYGGSVNAETGEGQKEWALIASYAGEQLPGKWISDRDAYAAGKTPTIGAQVVYKLAAPAPFVATGNQQIPALSGVNTVLTDVDTLTVRARENRPQTWQEIEALGDQIDTLTTRLKSGKLADAELHLGFYLDEDGDLCQKEE